MRNFPRVAPRTRPQPAPLAKLPPLKVAIYDHGDLAKIIELPDPRNGFVETFNREWGGKFGMEARFAEGGEAHE